MKSKDGDPKTRAWALFLATHARVLERIESTLAEAGLPPLAWYDVLWELEKTEQGKLRMHELAQRIVLSRSNLTRLADRLEKAKLLQRESCVDDRRGAYCVITAAGKKTREKMWPIYQQQIDELFTGHLNSTEAAGMASTFEKILASTKA